MQTNYCYNKNIPINQTTTIKIRKQIQKHIKHIHSLSNEQLQILQSLYHHLESLQQQYKQQYNTLNIPVRQYLHNEQKLRLQLVKHLKLERLSIYYTDDNKFNPLPSPPIIKKHTSQNEYYKLKQMLLNKYENFVDTTPKNIRNQAQQFRTLEYKIYIQQKQLFLNLPDELQQFLYRHFNIKKLPIETKKYIIQNILSTKNKNINYNATSNTLG